MKPHFVIDAQLPRALARFLEGQGYIAEHVNSLRLGGMSDAHIWSYVVRHQAVLVTKDEDFIELAERSKKIQALIWVKLGNTRNRVLLAVFARALSGILESVRSGERIIVIE